MKTKVLLCGIVILALCGCVYIIRNERIEVEKQNLKRELQEVCNNLMKTGQVHSCKVIGKPQVNDTARRQ